MLELRRAELGIVRVYTRDVQVDDFADIEGAEVYRLSNDDALMACARADVERVTTAAITRLNDPTALVIDDSDSFCAWELTGEQLEPAFERLSAIEYPSTGHGFFQGLVTDVPAKVIVRDNSAVVLVSSTLDHHLRRTVLTACASLGVTESRRDAEQRPQLVTRGSQ